MPGLRIAIFAPAPRSGKTTAANKIVNSFNATPLSFAEPIKKMGHVLLKSLGCVRYEDDSLKDQIIPEIGKSYRDILISLGQGLRKDIDDQIFTKILISKLKQIPHSIGVVVADLRTPSEWHALAEEGFKFIFVDRGLSENSSMEGQLNGLHSDYVVLNDGDIDKLEAKIYKIAHTEEAM